MSAEIIQVDGDYSVVQHVPSTPTVTVRVPRASLGRYLRNEMPYVLTEPEPEDKRPFAWRRSQHVNSRWQEGFARDGVLLHDEWVAIQADRALDPDCAPGTSVALSKWYTDRFMQSEDYINYRLLGKTPHLDTPDAIIPFQEVNVGDWRSLQDPFYSTPAGGVFLYMIDSGWFEGMDYYGLSHSDNPKLKFTNPDFPERFRKACMFTAMTSQFISTSSRFRYGCEYDRDPNTPLLRVHGLVGFAGSRLILVNPEISCYWTEHDIGFTIRPATGEYFDLGDPATEEFEANVNITGSWFMPSWRSYRQKSSPNRTIRPGMRFSDLFTEHATRGVAESILSESLDWNDRVSCDQAIPFGAVAGWRRIKRCAPSEYHAYDSEYTDPKHPLIVASSNHANELVPVLRETFNIGSVLRANGLALTTTSEAVKAEDHHLLEMVSKGTVVPHGRRRWYREPEHKRVYTAENAEQFKSYLVEGQEGNASAASAIRGMNNWDFLMGLGKLMEGFKDWLKATAKEDQKVVRKWEREHPGEKITWRPYPQFFNVKVEVA